MKVYQRTVALAAAIGFVIAPAAFAQAPAPAAPASQPPRKLISPIRGEATVEYTRPNTTRKGGNIVTIMVIKNTSAMPIAGFRLEESWADKSGNLAGGDVYRHPKPFMPGEVITVTLTTPPIDWATRSTGWSMCRSTSVTRSSKPCTDGSCGTSPQPGRSRSTVSRAGIRPATGRQNRPSPDAPGTGSA